LRMRARLEAIDRGVSPRRTVLAPFSDDAKLARMFEKTVDVRRDDHIQVQKERGSAQIRQGTRERAEFLPEAFLLTLGLLDRGQWPRLDIGSKPVGVVRKTNEAVGPDEMPPEYSPQAVHITGIIACAPFHADDVDYGTRHTSTSGEQRVHLEHLPGWGTNPWTQFEQLKPGRF